MGVLLWSSWACQIRYLSTTSLVVLDITMMKVPMEHREIMGWAVAAAVVVVSQNQVRM